MDTGYSLSDIRAATENGVDGFGMGGSWLWFLIVILFLFSGNGGWLGNNGGGAISDLERDVLNGNCTTQKEVIDSRYTTQLGFQNIGSQMASCCCSIEKAIANEGAATRQLIQDNNIQELRDRLATANNALTTQTIINQVVDRLQPVAKPAYITCSPYTAYNFPYGYYGGPGCTSTL